MSYKIPMKKKHLIAVAFLLPALLGLIIFRIYPLIMSVYDSLFQYSFANKEHFFAGLKNYIEAFTDASFLNSIKVTLILNLIVNPVQVILSFGLALLLIVKLKGQKVFRTLHLIPVTVSFTIACTLWGVLLSPEQGLMNSLLNIFGIANQTFLNDKSQALAWVIVIASWKGIGYWLLFFIAGLEDIPTQLHEAAAIDGTNYFIKLRYIILPLMKRTFMFVIVSDTISNFLMFVPPYILTGGGPEGTTDFMMFRIYKSAYKFSNINLASAMIVILLAMLLIVIAIESRLLRSKDD